MSSSLFSEQTCPRCGAKASRDAVTCPICGYWLRPMNYLPVLVVVVLVALLDIGLIVMRGVPRSALAISASELPPAVTIAPASPSGIALATPVSPSIAATTEVKPPTVAVTAVAFDSDMPAAAPSNTATAVPTATPPPTATALPTATPPATATAVPTATPPPTATAVPPATDVAPLTEPAPPEPTPDAAHVEESRVSFVSLDLAQRPTAEPVDPTALSDASSPPPAAPAADAPEPTPEPTATPDEGHLWLRNYIGSELVVTVTSQEVIWATTFRVAPMGETTIVLSPGHYTVTASPSGGEDKHGEFDLASGQRLEMPITAR